MADLGWRARSAALPKKAVAIEGLRDDFGVRVKSAVEAMREEAPTKDRQSKKAQKGKLTLQNKGVSDRASKDFEMMEISCLLQTDEGKEEKRLEALERKARMYEELQKRVDLDDEAANDLHEVDFIAKALDGNSHARHYPAAGPPSLHPEDILRRQQEIKKQMQGGFEKEEYSTYDQDTAAMEAQFRRVDELNQMNAEREMEIDAISQKRARQEETKKQQGSKHKNAILQKLLQKRQKLK